MPKMTERELRAVLAAEKADALGAAESSKLSDERSKAMDFYLGDMAADMPTLPDRSAAISTDVSDTVEGLMPSLMEIFCGGDEVVEFKPDGQEDEQLAQQETDYVNYVFMEQNNGFLILYTMIKDALLQKNGIVKVWYESKEEEERVTKLGLSPDAYMMLRAEIAAQSGPKAARVSIAEHTENDDGTHDVTVVRTRKVGQARVDNIPPEEFGVTRRQRSVVLRDCDYCYHETKKTVGDLIAQGFDAEQVKALPSAGSDEDSEDIARNTVEDTDSTGDAALNKMNREVAVTEHYALLDYEGDGKPRRYRVTTAGESDEVLRRDGKPDIVVENYVRFAAATPVINTHRFFGRSIADLVMDLQRMGTALTRLILDNAYLANNQRMEVVEGFATENTIDDILSNRPGGVVRTKMPGGLVPIPNSPLAGDIFPLLQYKDATREWRTGVTRQGQGIDADALQNQTAAAVTKVYSAAQARMRLIARIIAETGLKELFWILHATLRENETEAQTAKLRNKWVPVDPREWKSRNNLTVNVGLGMGTRDQQVAFLMNLLAIQKEALMVPGSKLVTPKNIYATLERLVRLGELKSIDPYFTDPDTRADEATPPDPKTQEAMAKLQIADQEGQAKIRLAEAEATAQLRIKIAELEKEGKIRLAQLDQEGRLKLYQIDQEMALKADQIERELEMKERLSRETAHLDAKAKVESAAVSGVHVGGEPG